MLQIMNEWRLAGQASAGCWMRRRLYQSRRGPVSNCATAFICSARRQPTIMCWLSMAARPLRQVCSSSGPKPMQAIFTSADFSKDRVQVAAAALYSLIRQADETKLCAVSEPGPRTGLACQTLLHHLALHLAFLVRSHRISTPPVMTSKVSKVAL